MPSRARALASGPASIARGDELLGELERVRLRFGVVPADEGVLVRTARLRRGPRLRGSGEPATTGRLELRWIRSASDSASRRREDAVLRETKLGRDGEHRRRADGSEQPRASRARHPRCREDDEVGAAEPTFRRTRDLDLERGRVPRSASREPMTTSTPGLARRTCERAAERPVPPTTATRRTPPPARPRRAAAPPRGRA